MITITMNSLMLGLSIEFAHRTQLKTPSIFLLQHQSAQENYTGRHTPPFHEDIYGTHVTPSPKFNT